MSVRLYIHKHRIMHVNICCFVCVYMYVSLLYYSGMDCIIDVLFNASIRKTVHYNYRVTHNVHKL